MKKLYKYSGHLNSLFVADEEDVRKSIGKTVYFSQWYCELRLSEHHFSVITDDQEFIAKFLELGCDILENPLLRLADQSDFAVDTAE